MTDLAVGLKPESSDLRLPASGARSRRRLVFGDLAEGLEPDAGIDAGAGRRRLEDADAMALRARVQEGPHRERAAEAAPPVGRQGAHAVQADHAAADGEVRGRDRDAIQISYIGPDRRV